MRINELELILAMVRRSRIYGIWPNQIIFIYIILIGKSQDLIIDISVEMTTPYVTGVTSGSGVRPAEMYTVGAPTTTTAYLPGTTSTYTGPTTTYGAPVQAYVTGTTTTYPTTSYVTGTPYIGQGYLPQSTLIGGGAVVSGATSRVPVEEIPVESRIQYIPFEKKYIEYDRVERIERIPFERQIVEYEEVYHTQKVPVEKIITDYYAVETQIQYIPKEIEETIVEYEPVERTWQRVQYLPVETQIVHYPEREKYVAGQSKYIKAGPTTGSQVYTSGYVSGPVATSTYISGSRAVPGAQTYTYTSSGPTNAVYGTGLVGSGVGYATGAPVTTTTYTTGVPTYTTGAYTTGVPGAIYGSGAGYGTTTGGYVTGPTATYSVTNPNQTYVSGGSGILRS